MGKMWRLALAAALAFASCGNFGGGLRDTASLVGSAAGGLVAGAIGGAAGSVVGGAVGGVVETTVDATGAGLTAARAAADLEKVAAHATGEVKRVLPAAARLWIHNNAATDQALASGVIDNMTAALLASGFTVVERGRIDLVVAEQNLHMGGAVTDRDFVSIGNLAGANTAVIVGIVGTGAARRLQVRVLDIETGTVTMQSGAGSEWSL